MGLSDSYSNIKDRIMLLDPLPTLNCVFSMIQQQEQQHQVISTAAPFDLMAMMVKPNYPTSRNNPKGSRPYCSHCKIPGHSLENCFKIGNVEAPVCSHCQMTGHNVEKCYKLHGYLPGHKLHNKYRLVAAAATYTSSPDDDQADDSIEFVALTKGQYKQLRALLHLKETSPPMASIAVAQPPSNQVHPSRVSGLRLLDNGWDE